MNLDYKKYVNLFWKDLLISKSMIFLVIYFLIFVLFYPKIYGESLQSNLFSFITSITLMEMLLFGNQQVVNAEKNHGNDLLVTTMYSRKDLITSRYFFIYLLSIIFMVLDFTLTSVLYPSVAEGFWSSLSYIFIVLIGNSIIVPLTFKLKSNLVYTFVGLLCLLPVYLFSICLSFVKVFLYPRVLCLVLFLLAGFMSYFSLKISKKVYLNKSL